MNAPAPERTGEACDRWVVRALVASQFGPPFLFSGVAVALPSMGQELGMSARELGLVETVFLASGTAFLLPAGKLADVTGRRTLLRWGLFAFALASLAIAFAHAAWLVLGLRFAQGLFSALCGAAAPALLTELVPAERRGRVFGAVMGVAYAGLATGPLLAGPIVVHCGWRAVFVFGSLLIVVAALPLWLRLRKRWLPPGDWVHLPSLGLLTLAAAAVVAGVSMPDQPVLAGASLAVGIAALVWFLRLQLRVERALLDLRELGRNRVLSAALLVQLLLYGNAYCAMFLQSLFLQGPVGLTPTHAGFALASGSLVMMLVAPFAGRLADRVPPQRVAAVGAIAVLVSSCGGLCLDAEIGVPGTIAVLMIQGVGFGLFSSPNMAVIMGALPRERAGMASALAAQSRGIGMVAGMAITGGILAVVFGAAPVREHPERVVSAMHTTYLLLVVTSGVAAFVARQHRAPLVPKRDER